MIGFIMMLLLKKN